MVKQAGGGKPPSIHNKEDIMKKLTSKQLVKKIEERLDKKDAKKVGNSIAIYSLEDFQGMVEYYQLEERDGFGTLVYDANIESIIEDLFYNEWTADGIIKEFLGFYSINDILASENGEGLMFIRA